MLLNKRYFTFYSKYCPPFSETLACFHLRERRKRLKTYTLSCTGPDVQIGIVGPVYGYRGGGGGGGH